MADCLELLHFHLGSQITNIRQIKAAVIEAARIYVELARAGAGLKLPGRRRRAGHRLRRLADGLRIQRQLHPAGIRQRHRLPRPERVRRGRGAAPHHHVRERPRRGRLPQRAGVQRSGRERVRRGRTRRPRCRPRRRAAADRPAGDLPLAEHQEPAGELPRRAAGPGPGPEPVQPGLPAARAAVRWPRTCTGPSAAASSGWPRTWSTSPRSWRAWTRMLSDTYFCNFSLVPEHARQLGHQAVVPDHAHPPAGRAAHAARRAGRHLLRLRRQDRPVHRPARREAHPAAAPLQRRAVLPGRVSGRRLPGDPGRPAQPVRRHQRRARQPERERRGHPGHGDQGRHGARGARLRAVQLGHPARAASGATSRPPCARAASATRNPAACCASTKTACTATPTWRTRTRGRRRPAGSAAPPRGHNKNLFRALLDGRECLLARGVSGARFTTGRRTWAATNGNYGRRWSRCIRSSG